MLVMKNQKLYKKILCNLSQKTSGFTLTELLVAIIITAILVTGTGVGLNTILQANDRSEQETLRRRQGNRALNYISEDIREASEIQEGEEDDEIFTLIIPDPDRDNITYSLYDAEEDLLAGQVIYRREGDNSDYDEPLIDLVDDEGDNEEDRSDFCNNEEDTDIWGEDGGFYICVDGRQAEIVIRSELDNGDMIRVRTRAFARSSN